MDKVESLARQVLGDARIMSLATIDSEGPWCAQVGFVSDGWSLYWVSKPDTRHSRAIVQHHKVSIAILAEWALGIERALQMEAIAESLEGDQYDVECALREKLGKEVLAKPMYVEQGYVWYRAKPTSLFLLHHDFEYNRQRVL